MNNVVEKFKKGSKIHIKESQKGSFTKWCGGNVTSECIQRGKNSSNPKIRKKATFADNARKWKHQMGGTLGQEAINNNQSNKNIAKGLFKGIFTGEYLPSMQNVGKMITSAYKGWIDPEQKNPYLQAGVPEILPGRVNIPAATGLSVRTVKPLRLFNKPMNPAERQAALDFIEETGIKVNTQLPIGRPSYKGMFGEDIRLPKIKVEPEVKPIPKKTAAQRSAQYSREKVEDKGNKIGKNKRDAFNEAKAYAEGDARKVHVTGRSYSKIDNSQLNTIVEKIHLYPQSVQNKVNRFRVNIEKASTKEGKTQSRKQLREYLRSIRDQYGIYKQGGIIKFQNGGITEKLLELGLSGYNMFKTNNNISNYQNSSNKQISLGKEAILNDVGDVSSEVQKRLNKLKEQNPDQNFGNVDVQMLTNQVTQERRAQNQQKADMFEQQEREKQLEAINALQGTTNDSYENLINSIGGIAESILNNKKNSSNLNFNTTIEPKLTTNNYTTNNSTNFFKTGIMGGYINSPFYYK